MNKKVYAFFIIFIFIQLVFCGKAFAVKNTGLDIWLTSRSGANTNGTLSSDTTNDAEWLKENLGYKNHSDVLDKMILDTTIKIIKKKSNNTYLIQFGKDGANVNSKDYISEDDLKNIYGCYEKDPKEGDTWKVILKVSWVAWETTNVAVLGNAGHDIKINEIYAGPDKNEEDYKWAKENVQDDGKDVGEKIGGADQVGEELIDKGEEVINAYESIKDVVKNFQHNPVGTILSIVIEFFGQTIGDGLQSLANWIQAPEHILGVEYERMDLQKEDSEGDRNKYTRVYDYNKGNGRDWQKVIDIEKTDDQDNRFDEDTKIPVMIGDIYNVAVGHIDVFDINFLKVSKANKKNTAWMVLRNFIANLIHISFYIACATLLVNLIIGGITIVRSSFDNPEQQAEAKRRIDSLGTSVATLIGTVVIMALSIYGSNQIFSGLDNTKNVELPIRVNVEGAGYSFSTTAAGYFKYMSHFNDVDEWIEKGFYTLGYIVLAILNLLMIVVMLLRMLALWILAIAGPLIAVLSVWNLDSKNLFRTWVKLYVGLSMIPVAISIIYLLLLDIAI